MTSTNPIDIARETLRQLAARRVAPTPDNYRSLYLEIANVRGQPPDDERAHFLLAGLIERLRAHRADLRQTAATLATAAEDRTWDASCRALIELAECTLQHVPPPRAAPAAPAPQVAPVAVPLHGLLAQLLEAVSKLGFYDELRDEARVLAGRVRTVTGTANPALAESLQQFMKRLEIRGECANETHAGLLRLLRLLVDNIADLVIDDSWVKGQLAAIRALLATPDNLQALQEAESCIREMLGRQGSLRTSLLEARSSLKSMVETLIDRLGTLADDTGEYQSRIENYSQRLEHINDDAELGALLDDVLADTRRMKDLTESSRSELIAARARAATADQRVRALETELASVSAKVREDQLTGTLNRRGFEEAYARETARAQRHDYPLAIAMLDIDNFKQLNDSFGHLAGDHALQHLVRVIRDTLRPSDVVCRYGGEEFALILPETSADDALQILTRLQRELTRCFFLHDNERILITFSAGITLWRPDEPYEAVAERTDLALYKAKNLGKNRVCLAD